MRMLFEQYVVEGVCCFAMISTIVSNSIASTIHF